MKKKLFTLLLCAFAAMGANAAHIEDGGATLVIDGGTSDANALVDFSKIEALDGYKSDVTITKIVMSGDFTDGWSGNWLINGGTTDPSAVTTIDLSGATFGSGSWQFNAFNNLTEIIWPTNNSLTVIPEYAFKNCSVTTLTVPTSVKEIQAHAFELNGLTTITIPEGSQLEIIRKEAFNNCKDIKDVYVYATPRAGSGSDTSFGNITYFPWCEEQAFPYDIMVNQTAIATGGVEESMATLHFDEAWFDFFCGNWKRGLAFTQKNLNSIKDGYYDEDNNKLGPNNGWQQFALTGSPTEQKIPEGEFVRTWSSSTAYVIPIYRWKDTATDTWKSGDIFKCYRVTDYTYAKTGSSVKLTKLEEVMPANTGMILRSAEVNEENALVFMLEATGNKYDLTQYPYGSENYLETSIDETPIGPVTLENGKVAYRNFGLYGGNGSYQFVRYKEGKIRPNRAYLKLSKDQFPNNNESATDGPGSGLDTADSNEAGAKISLVFLDEVEEGNEATGISVVNTKQADNTYYNLQGMKVENPSKGIYIYNGKKVIK